MSNGYKPSIGSRYYHTSQGAALRMICRRCLANKALGLMSADGEAPQTTCWQFSNRTSLVTGAASAIGQALALALATAGARRRNWLPARFSAGSVLLTITRPASAYLLSDEASFVTGQVLHVNGDCVMP